MTSIRSFRLRATASSLLAVAFAILLASPAFAGMSVPASDLTITVQELENGDVEFSASGTGYGKSNSSFYQTPADYMSSTPPHTLGDNYDSIEIDPGVVLTVPVYASEPEDGPEELAPMTNELGISYIFFNSGGYWTLGSFGGYIQTGDPITGSGSVVTSAVPFSHFVPGTYMVTSGPFDITYKVLPYSPPAPPVAESPALSIQNPRRFPNTTVGRSSRPQRIRVRNVGKAPATGISVKVSGSDFSATQVAKKSLAPGATSSFRATFRPKRAGIRRATISVSSNAPKTGANLSGRGVEAKKRSPLLPFR